MENKFNWQFYHWHLEPSSKCSLRCPRCPRQEHPEISWMGQEISLNEFKKVGDLITKVVEGLSKNPEDNTKNESEVRKEVIELCSKFPIYNHLIKN